MWKCLWLGPSRFSREQIIIKITIIVQVPRGLVLSDKEPCKNNNSHHYHQLNLDNKGLFGWLRLSKDQSLGMPLFPCPWAHFVGFLFPLVLAFLSHRPLGWGTKIIIIITLSLQRSISHNHGKYIIIYPSYLWCTPLSLLVGPDE